MPLSNLFQQLETLIPSLDGWCTVERACELAAIVVGLKPQTTVCLGVWGGRDTFALALAHRHNGIGKVIAIDPWKAEASVVGQHGEDAKWWGNQESHDLIYNRFMATVQNLNIADYIDVRRQRSDDVTPPRNVGLLIIDGNHGPQSIKDVERFAKHVHVGGYVYMDDLAWSGGSVAQAAQNLQAMGFRNLYQRDTGAFFQATK